MKRKAQIKNVYGLVYKPNIENIFSLQTKKTDRKKFSSMSVKDNIKCQLHDNYAN